MGKYRVSVDIGGTFTDLVFYNMETGAYKAGKTLTTPKDLSEAVVKGLDSEIASYGDIDFFVHGTTSGLNAFLERKGVKVALITTKGFGDVYEIGRGNRPEMYDFTYRKPKPLIDRIDSFEVEERILSDGSVRTPLAEERVKAIGEKIREKAYLSVAVCLINAYVNPVHEVAMERILREMLPGVSLSLSHRIAREWREYERTSTTVINAYIAPIVQRYLNFLETRMQHKGFERNVHIMQSGGGVITAEIAKETPIQTLLSGPVGGAVGNKSLAELSGYRNLIGVDMGGTSYDVSLVINGRPDVSTETRLEGFPILVPMVNIYTIGAGGGSIAWIEGGGLRVGPVSAGSDPGPACYAGGGTEATITDANVVLGRIDPEGFLGGSMVLDKEAALRVVKKVADQLNLGIQETAEGICKIADAKMADAIRQLTVRKGIDPREFVLVAFGGAGPMHACLTAEELNIDTILVPEMPGTFSAWGMLQSDIRQDAVRTMKSNADKLSLEKVNEIYQEMMAEVSALLRKQEISSEKSGYLKTADMRYVGQEYTVRVSFAPGLITAESMTGLKASFHELHQQIYGHNNPAGDVEIVNLRLVGIGQLDKKLKQKVLKQVTGAPVPRKTGRAVFYGREFDTAIYNRQELHPGQEFMGPAIVEELTATTVVPPGYHVTLDEYGHILIQKMPKGGN
ncbi:hydantoinase/oxoprolinase family protein [Candidatus Formimonas warabiya]|uniref:hydantoinase/oxoprolinase family protein n=1 Tax=Formimonas warabiya TaxID=1761012 RepID=UPI0011D0CBAA|nr:hydantoinase/oxoprolinase family protein [Candidatus Formimonas warabiya]